MWHTGPLRLRENEVINNPKLIKEIKAPMVGIDTHNHTVKIRALLWLSYDGYVT